MEGLRLKKKKGKGVGVIILMVMVRCVLGTLHRVGGKMGWSQNVNFTQWSAHENFYLHDWLVFNFNKQMYNVLEVNKTSYESCNDQGFIKNITKGGRDVVQLNEVRPYYYLSGRGFCWGGMKVAIFVQEAPPPPAQPPLGNASPSNTGGPTMVLVVASLSIALTFMGYYF